MSGKTFSFSSDRQAMAEHDIPKSAYSANGKHQNTTSSDWFEVVQQQSDGFLASKGGSSLPIEICLKIVEDVLSSDPKVGLWVLKAVSKSFRSLLSTYEYSITKRVSTIEGTDNLYPLTLLPSWPRNARPVARSYSWLCEVRCRTDTIESLINHDITRMISSPDSRFAIDLPLPDVPDSELLLRIKLFKRNAIHLLYGMADGIAAVSGAGLHAIRAYQCSHFVSLTTTELAVLGVFTRILGFGYFRLAKCNHANKPSDSIRDRWIVFEDRVLRYGPFLAWATVVQRTGPIHEWSNEVISDALEDMEGFESGRLRGYASLQSVLWKVFCARKECDMFDSWDEARKMVEKEMLSYEV